MVKLTTQQRKLTQLYVSSTSGACVIDYKNRNSVHVVLAGYSKTVVTLHMLVVCHKL